MDLWLYALRYCLFHWTIVNIRFVYATNAH